MSSAKTLILDDLPTDIDRLDFQPYVETLAEVICTGSTPPASRVSGCWPARFVSSW